VRGRDPGLRWLQRKAGEIHCTYMDSPFRERDGWKDGETSYVRVNVWHDLAEHVVDSLSKGDRVVVVGRLRTRAWETPCAGLSCCMPSSIPASDPILTIRAAAHL
jgi:single-strand DNA-binding protein